MSLTTKQLEIVKIIGIKNDDGTLIDLDQLLDRLSYKPTKPALQFSIRSLIKVHGLVEKAGEENRRDRRRVLFQLTHLGKHVARPWIEKAESDQEQLRKALTS